MRQAQRESVHLALVVPHGFRRARTGTASDLFRLLNPVPAEPMLTAAPALAHPPYPMAWQLLQAYFRGCGAAFALTDAFAGVTADPERALFTHAEVRRGGRWVWLHLPEPYLALRLRDQLHEASGNPSVQHLALHAQVAPDACYLYLFQNTEDNLRHAHPTFGKAGIRQVAQAAVRLQQASDGWRLQGPGGTYAAAETLAQALPVLYQAEEDARLETEIACLEGLHGRWRSHVL